MWRQLRGASVVAAALALCAMPIAASAQSDVQPPQLIGLSVNPGSVDVTSAEQAFTFTAHVTDDLSGVDSGGVWLWLTSPSSQQVYGFASFQPVTLDGTFIVPVTVPRFSEPGTWTVEVFLRDRAGNLSDLTPANLTSKGFPSAVSVLDNTPDLSGPQLTAVAISPAIVDVTAGDRTIDITMTITDDASGFAQLETFLEDVALTSPSNGQTRVSSRISWQLLSGDALNGVWRAQVTMPRFSEAGVWRLTSVALGDYASNRRFYSEADLESFGAAVQITVNSAPVDVTAPQLAGLQISPASIETSTAGATVSLNLQIADNLSGVSFAPDTLSISRTYGASFVSPSGQQRVYTNFPFAEIPPSAGNTLNGIWNLTVPFPRFAEAGTWRIGFLTIRDAVRNIVDYSSSQLQALGIPTTIEVIRPSLVPDGTVGNGGGTVQDETFSGHAQVTFPPGALPSNTSVAIDVLTTPPAIPNPTGYSTGTLFTSITLSPVPPMPFPAPGLTLVLPLPAFKAPGSLLRLFRLDPVSGVLVPAQSVSGGTVAGRVNADGFSATFTGVSHLSTLVGFLENGVLGDVDADGLVTCADLAIVRAAFGKRVGQVGYDVRADVNGDGVVNVIDLSIVSRQMPAGTRCQ